MRHTGGRRLRSPIPFAIVLALAGVPAHAELRSLEVPANAGWQHAETGLVLRSKLAGLPRTSLQDNGAAELDVIVNFAAPDKASIITVYLFRPALMSVPVWFDRSETQILSRDVYGGAQPVGEARAFAPPSAQTASGLRRIYLTNAEYKVTGLAVMPLGEWLVAIRISARDADPVALEAKLDEAIGALGWPKDVKDAAAAAPVAACPTPLAYAKRARLQKPTMVDGLIGAALLGAVAEQAADEVSGEERTIVYCRDAPGKSEYGIYRDSGDLGREAYVMALGDAGRTIAVAPSLGALVDNRKGYMLSFADLDKTLIYPNFDKLASPEQALDAVNSASPISSTARGTDGDSTITIGTDSE